MLKTKSLVGAIAACGVCVVLTVSCASAPEPTPSYGVDATWLNRMHRLSAAMTELLPLASSSEQFFDPRNSEMIKQNLSELAQASKELADDQRDLRDPLIQHTARVFAQDMSYAASHFGNGNKQMSQFLAASIPVYCISCHTRTDRGTQDFPMTWATDLQRLSGSQKTQYYLANRQYGSAIKETGRLVKSASEIKNDILGWRKAVESTLAVYVRVERDVEQTIALAKAVTENTALPSYIRDDAKSWLKDAKAWRAENLRLKTQLSIEQKFQIAKRLLEQGKSQQKDESHSALISNLRASALLHEVMEHPESKRYAESLFLAGETSELLKDVIVPGLNEAYYESCITASPHSKLAEKCYSQLEISVQKTSANYSESSGIPELRNKRLLDFSDLARVPPPRNTERLQ